MNERDEYYNNIIANLTHIKDLDKNNEDKLNVLESKYNQLITGLEKLICDLKYN